VIIELRKDLKSVLAEYKENVGHGFFTRQSRLSLLKNLAKAKDQRMVELLLDFAGSMQGKKPDIGFFGYSRLQHLLWRADESGKSVYQKLYEFLQIDPLGKKICERLAKKEKYQFESPHSKKAEMKSLETLIGYNWNDNHSLRRIL
jgi:hypothetical protein